MVNRLLIFSLKLATFIIQAAQFIWYLMALVTIVWRWL
jgi:hypothetical protein